MKHGVFLSLRAGKVHSGAVVVFRQAMVGAELVSAVRTSKRKKRFLSTLSTFHMLRAPFFAKENVGVYMFPSENVQLPIQSDCAKRLKQSTPN